MERRALIIAQRPRTCVLGCSDSRVPVEIVFDQGLGDMFVIRGAGNVADAGTLASVEYAVQHLRVKVRGDGPAGLRLHARCFIG